MTDPRFAAGAAAGAAGAGRAIGPAFGLALALLATGAAPVPGQGPGSAGAEILQIGAGARASALGGAYTAVADDPDAVFYNPAAVAALPRSASLAYQAYVEDVTLGSFSGALGAGRRFAFGAGLLFLDAGDIEEVVPDPTFGGERGRETGSTVGATEAAARLAGAFNFAQGRASAGVALGFLTSDLAGVARRAAFVDLGAQARVGQRLSVGASLRNLGTGMSSDEMGDTPLPSQARLGATYRRPIGAVYGAAAFADAVWGIEEETGGLALGVEGGLLPPDRSISAVLRLGATLGEGEGHLGRLRFGGGVAVRGIGLDYSVQVFEYLGAIHRVGLRWSR